MASTILSRGFKKPTAPDAGSIWFTDLETNIDQLNDHTHNGANSAPLAKTQSILKAAWVDDGTLTGTYKQTITLPTLTNGAISYQLKFDEISTEFRVADANTDRVFPRLKKLTANSYEIYVNDNSLDLTALYI